MTERFSFSLTTFSPSGKLVQIEYALNAVAAGAASVGIKGTTFVALYFIIPPAGAGGKSPLGSGLWPETLRNSFNRTQETVCFVAKNGVVLAAENKTSALVQESSIEKIAKISKSIGMTYSGLGPDFSVLECKNREKKFGATCRNKKCMKFDIHNQNQRNSIK
uniref:Proteasome subunit alpha type n=1 Tax=Romanomermis culicivorax TaxID=13658 RepID=A0A915I235_ROMCU